MKVNEVVLEGLWSDLVDLGRVAQRDPEMAHRLGQQAVSQAGGLTKAISSGQLGQMVGRVAKTAQTTTLAKTIAAAWNKELENITANQAPMQPAEYQQRFAAWLEQTMHGEVAVDEKRPEFQRYITGANPDVLGYLVDYFIPAYQALKVTAPPQIPNNTQVIVRGATAGKTKVKDEIYTWNNGRWTDSKGGAVTAGSNLHQSLTSDAINNLKANRATAQTV